MVNNKNIEIVFLIAIIILSVFNVYLASKTAFLGEDEALYNYLGEQISELKYDAYAAGKQNIAPPFMPVLYSTMFLIFGSYLSVAKAVTAILGFLTLLMVYIIGRKINIYVGIFSVAILLLMTLFAHMSMLTYVDVPTAFFSVLLTYMVVNLDSNKKAVTLGVLMGVSYFVKVSTVYIIMIFMLYSVYLFISKKNRQHFRLSLISLGVSVLVILPIILRNITLYNYPFFIVLDILFPASYGVGWTGIGALTLSQVIDLNFFVSAFEWIPLVLSIFGSIYVFSERKKTPAIIQFSTMLFLLFVLMFTVLYSLGKTIAESRYLLIIFPQLALTGGYFLYELKERNKYLLILLLPLVAFAFYSNVSVGLATSESTRFPANYIQALEWVKNNSPQDALIFTTYGGSVRNYAHRDNIWVEISEFAKIMTTDNATYVHDILKRYNVSYVVIWRGVVAESYVVPHANLAGVFSYQFVRATTTNATDVFKSVYQNEDNIVLQVV